MTQNKQQRTRKAARSRSDIPDARPLIQAIFLGMLLAAALVAAAAMANQDAPDAQVGPDRPVLEQSLSG